MKYSILLIIFLMITGIVHSQDKFPESWIGNYEGNLEIYAIDSIGIQLKMKIDIHPTKNDSIHQWVITYDFKGQEDIRSYELKLVDAKTGHYQIDEKNSIVIDSYYRYGILTSYFEVNKSVIIASYKKQNDTIVFEIISSQNEAVSTTGNSKIEGEEIPEVLSYPVTGRQRCILKQIKI